MELSKQIQSMEEKIAEIQKKLQEVYDKWSDASEAYHFELEVLRSVNPAMIEVVTMVGQEGYRFFDQDRREWIFVVQPKRNEIENHHLNQSLVQYQESLAQLQRCDSYQKTIDFLRNRVQELESENQSLREMIDRYKIILYPR